jgi:hypothetical protein
MSWPTNSRPKHSGPQALDFYGMTQLFGNNEHKKYAQEIKDGLAELAVENKKLQELWDSTVVAQAALAAKLAEQKKIEDRFAQMKAEWESRQTLEKAALKEKSKEFLAYKEQLDSKGIAIYNKEAMVEASIASFNKDKQNWLASCSETTKALEAREAAVVEAEKALAIRRKKLKEALNENETSDV